MKKTLTFALATFVSLGMLSACNTQNRDVTNDNNDKVGFQPVRYNPYNRMNNDNLTRDGRVITIGPDIWQGNTNGNMNQWTFPNNNVKQQTVPTRDQYLNNTLQTPNQNNTTNITKAPTPAPNTNATNNKTNVTTPNNQATGSFQSQVVQLTNQERQKNGLPALQSDSQVSKVAQTKTDDMASKNYFSHTSPTYGSPFQMLKDFGVSYKTAAENIAEGQTTPQQVVNSWMNSSGHRANILSKDVTHIGVGYSKNGNYWSQMFIGK